MGIEPTSKAWEALVLPMNYARLLLKSSRFKSDGTADALQRYNNLELITAPMRYNFIISFSKRRNCNITLIIRQEKIFIIIA